MYKQTYTYTYIHLYIYTYTYIHLHIYASNFLCRDRTAFYFFSFFNKSYLIDVFCNNANQLILTCWTHIGEIFS